MKKLKLKKWVINTLILVTFYSTIIVGVIAVNARLKKLNQIKSADIISYHESAQ